MKLLRIFHTDRNIDIEYKTDIVAKDQFNFTVMSIKGLGDAEKRLGINFQQLPYNVNEFKKFCSDNNLGLSAQTIGSPTIQPVEIWVEEGTLPSYVSIAITHGASDESGDIEVIVGEAVQLKVTATDSDDATEDVTTSALYSSSDDEIATVDSNGLVSTIGAGSAVISVEFAEINETINVIVTTE